MIINSRLSDQKLLEAIHKAAAEYSKYIGNAYLMIGKNRNSEYCWFQCHFEKKYFMHLLGIDSKTLSASQFYDKCIEYNNSIGRGIQISDCQPSRNHSRATVNEKSSGCAEIFQIQNAKYMKIGLKDKMSQFVDFTYAYGSIATLGFQKLGKATSFPITLIPRNIDEFISKKYRIVILFEKEIAEEKYSRVAAEIKKGIFSEIYTEFPEELKELIEVKATTMQTAAHRHVGLSWQDQAP